ncbi:Heterokaryon incompatibility protein 6, OR allele [Fusarium oxysporum f. sp. cubense race 1]|uniref:Heterokaryon incompatibility protein 6, OR allele n=1 Tax=Fusarium oxysporum f. sp. cubense (strain race 1) TaxID=1229664 RepID=N4UKM2_FUSC1|nr:Heterokaryon incompatibility protein 6, OR allele [Fusarium oxysporum f. sp. cubense race 1]
MKWPQGSLEYTKAYRAWLEWFESSEVALAKSCKQIIQDFDQLIRQTSERRRFIVTRDGQVGFGPEGADKGDVVVIIPGGKVPYVLRRLDSPDCGVRRYRLLGDAFINGAIAGEKVGPSTSELTKIVIV